jgi:hypothetical protein
VTAPPPPPPGHAGENVDLVAAWDAASEPARRAFCAARGQEVADGMPLFDPLPDPLPFNFDFDKVRESLALIDLNVDDYEMSATSSRYRRKPGAPPRPRRRRKGKIVELP